MTWNLIAQSDAYKAQETVLQAPAAGGDIRIALGFPNTYQVGMSNLGLQVVYSILNSLPGVVCERFFLPNARELEWYRQSGRRLFTLESQRPLSDFQIVAFSVAFELDYVHLPQILDLAGLPLFSAQRIPLEGAPLVIAGGAISLLNPEPLADLVDLFCLGEGENFLPVFIERYRAWQKSASRSKLELLQELAALPGAYIPSFWEARYEQGQYVETIPRPGAPANPPQRLHLTPQEYASTCQHSQILTEDTELGFSGLVELSRGCAFNCRFCTVGFSYPKIRWKPLEVVWSAIERLSRVTSKVGLISATAGTYPQLEELCERLIEARLSVAFSSLRVNNLPDILLRALVEGGSKTITLAPEVGSDALRRVANKLFTDAQYLESARRSFEAGMINLRMYSMVGLPGEEREHLQALVDLAADTRRLQVACGRGRGKITLSTGQLIPKPFTPFQWLPLLERSKASKALHFLERGVAKIGGVEFNSESPKLAFVQALLARGDRRLGQVLASIYGDPSFRAWQQAAKGVGIDLERELYTPRPLSESHFPWLHLAPAGSLERLEREESLYRRSVEALKAE